MTSVQLVSNEDPRLIPAWAPDTLYAVGHQVIAPTRTLVEAKVEHTSGATYEPEHWQTPLADVTAEAARAEAAETGLAASIATEATARANADTALSTGITNAIATAEAASDAVGTAATDVATEKTRALAAEGAIATNLATAVAGAITTAEGASDAAGTAAADVATEKTRALAAEALLVPLAQRGAANGVPTLDGEEHLTLSQVPPSVVTSSAPSAVVSRHGQFSLRDMISVKDFGAKGNGSAIDGPAIEEAIEAAHAEFNSGGFVYLPQGTYLTEHTIKGLGNIVLVADNPTSLAQPIAKIKATNGSNLDAVIATSNWVNNESGLGVGGFGCRYIGVDANKANQTGGKGHGIVLAGYRCFAQECAVLNPRGSGIVMASVMANGVAELTKDTPEMKAIRNVVLGMGEHGILVSEGASAFATDGFCVDNVCYTENAETHEGDGLHFMDLAGWLVQGNHCYGIGRNNIFGKNMTMARLLGNYCDGWGANAGGVNVAAMLLEGFGNFSLVGNCGTLSGHTVGAGNTPFGILYESPSSGEVVMLLMGNSFVGSEAGTGLRVQRNGTAKIFLAKPYSSNHFRKFSTNENVDALGVEPTSENRPEPVTLSANGETYTVPAGVTALRIVGRGNSGAGAGGGGGFTATHAGGGGGGGGAGMTMERIVTGVKPGTVLTAEIPAAAKGGKGGAVSGAGEAGGSGAVAKLKGTEGFSTLTLQGGGGGGGGGAGASGATGTAGTCGNYGQAGSGGNSVADVAPGVGGAGGSGDANAAGIHGGSIVSYSAAGGGGGASGGATEAGNGGTGGEGEAVGQGGAAGAGAAAPTAGKGGGGGGGGGGAINGSGVNGAEGSTGFWKIMTL